MRRRFLHTATAAAVMFVPAEAIAAGAESVSASAAPVLLSGTVTMSHGGVPVGTVTAYAWPDQVGAEPGDEFALIPLAHAPINPDGTFSLRAQPTFDLATNAAPNGGYLNLSLITRAAGSTQETGFARYLGTGPMTAASMSAWLEGPAQQAESVEVVVPSSPSTAEREAGQVPLQMVCYEERKLLEKSIAPTVVGEFHTEADTTNDSYFHYGESADSTISVAVKQAHESAWSVSGVSHVGNGRSGAIGKEGPRPNFHAQILTDFEYGRYRASNPCYGGRTYETVRALEWLGGSGERFYDAPGCRPDHPNTRRYQPGHFQKRNTHKARNWEKNISVFGASLSSRSGYSEFVESYWKFGDAYEFHYLCGDDTSVLKSERVFAGPAYRQPECRPGRPC
jgi:hypothetical protein